jgi:hypothetical protein
LQRFLAVLAIVIAGNILAAAAFRRVMLAYQAQPPIDPSILLVYGAMMTGLLALLYVPAYLGWQTKARELRDALCPLPSDGAPSHDWHVNRADLEGLLNLKVNAGAAFTTGLGPAGAVCQRPHHNRRYPCSVMSTRGAVVENSAAWSAAQAVAAWNHV